MAISSRLPRHGSWRKQNMWTNPEACLIARRGASPGGYFLGSASLRAISSTILGRSSASTLSTMLAMAAGLLAPVPAGAGSGGAAVPGRDASDGAPWGPEAGASANSSLAGAGLAADPAMESRMFFQLAAMMSVPPSDWVFVAPASSRGAAWAAAVSGTTSALPAATVACSACGGAGELPTGQGAGNSAPAAVATA